MHLQNYIHDKSFRNICQEPISQPCEYLEAPSHFLRWNDLRALHSGQALTLLVTVSSMHCCTSTSALSTSSSSRGFTSYRMGHLILRGASRLDAFSVYPFRTWLPGRRLGSLTGTPAVRPSRSSRTKDSSSQISYAHAG